MTPKEKAKELVRKFSNKLTSNQLNEIEDGLQCALIAVDEIFNDMSKTGCTITLDYWQEVKTEIENYKA